MIDSIFIQYPELRKYFYEAEERMPPQSERDRLFAVAELMLDYFDYVLLQQRRSPALHPHNFWSEEYLIDSFSASPILCEYLAGRKDWFSTDLFTGIKVLTGAAGVLRIIVQNPRHSCRRGRPTSS
jgi:hypothetical protein